MRYILIKFDNLPNEWKSNVGDWKWRESNHIYVVNGFDLMVPEKMVLDYNNEHPGAIIY